MGTLFDEISRRHFSYQADLADVSDRIDALDAMEARGDVGIILTEGVKLLNDRDEGVRHRAAEAVASVGTKEAAVAVTDAWERFDDLGLGAAAAALAGLGKEAVFTLRRKLEHSRAEIRAAAASALGRIDGKTVVTDLAAALADRDPRVVCAAALGLGNHRAVQCLDDLSVVYRRVPPARAAVVEALGQIGTPAALSIVRKALEDQDPAVREAAEHALEHAGHIN